MGVWKCGKRSRPRQWRHKDEGDVSEVKEASVCVVVTPAQRFVTGAIYISSFLYWSLAVIVLYRIRNIVLCITYHVHRTFSNAKQFHETNSQVEFKCIRTRCKKCKHVKNVRVQTGAWTGFTFFLCKKNSSRQSIASACDCIQNPCTCYTLLTLTC